MLELREMSQDEMLVVDGGCDCNCNKSDKVTVTVYGEVSTQGPAVGVSVSKEVSVPKPDPKPYNPNTPIGRPVDSGMAPKGAPGSPNK